MATISTTTKPAYVYDLAEDTWFPVGGLAQANIVIYEYVATGGQTTFSGPDANSVTLQYTVGALQVFLNGVLLSPGDDYTATNGTAVELASGATLNDVVSIVAFATFDVADTYTQAQVNALLGNAGLNSFLLMGA
jgi:hypothetical protein